MGETIRLRGAPTSNRNQSPSSSGGHLSGSECAVCCRSCTGSLNAFCHHLCAQGIAPPQDQPPPHNHPVGARGVACCIREIGKDLTCGEMRVIMLEHRAEKNSHPAPLSLPWPTWLGLSLLWPRDSSLAFPSSLPELSPRCFPRTKLTFSLLLRLDPGSNKTCGFFTPPSSDLLPPSSSPLLLSITIFAFITALNFCCQIIDFDQSATFQIGRAEACGLGVDAEFCEQYGRL